MSAFQPSTSDSQLRQDVLDELDFEPSIDAAHIGVAAEQGVVTLSGHVGSYAEKTAAVAAARRVRGVGAIADEIQVRYPSDKKTEDDEIAKRAVDILRWDSLVSSDSIEVTVRDGVVTLTGTAGWYYQRKNAEDDVRKLSGVRGVVNDIRIVPRVDPQNVRERIEDALRRYAAIEAGSVRVIVRGNGKIALEGEVGSWEERTAVETAAWSAPGVSAVEDLLTVA